MTRRLRIEDLPERPPEVQRKLSTFGDAVRATDDLGAVIRAHIHVEHELIAYIEARLKPDGLLAHLDKHFELDYDRRVKLALAVGLDAKFKSALTYLGRVRNQFAHRLEATLSVASMREFYKALDPTIKKLVQEQRPEPLQRFSMAQRDARTQFNLIAIALWTALLVENQKDGILRQLEQRSAKTADTR